MEKKDIIRILAEETGTQIIACESSNIIGYGYNQELQELWVAFKGQKVYKYLGITPEQFANLEAAESKGKWVNANLVKTKVDFDAYVLD